MSGGFQGFGSQNARARRSDALPMSKQEFMALLRSSVDPRSALFFGQQGLEVLIDPETMEYVTGSPVRLRAKVRPASTATAASSGDGYPRALGHLVW